MKRRKMLMFVLLVSIFLVLPSIAVLAQADPDADAVVETGDKNGSPGQFGWNNLQNALGALDEVYVTSESGMYNDLESYILLDMGEGEEIIDTLGDDFVVGGESCGFSVYVSNDTSSFEYAGYARREAGYFGTPIDIGNNDGAIYRYVKFVAYCDWLGPTDVWTWFFDGVTAYSGHYIPEFPVGVLLPLFMAITLLMVIVYRMKGKRCPKP